MIALQGQVNDSFVNARRPVSRHDGLILLGDGFVPEACVKGPSGSKRPSKGDQSRCVHVQSMQDHLGWQEVSTVHGMNGVK